MYPNLFAELIRRGWSDADLRKLAGENLLRAMAQAEKVAKRLQAERPASTLRFVAPPPAATTTSTPAQPPAPAPAVAPNGAPASPSR